MIKLKKVIVGVMTVLIIGIIMFAAVYDRAVDDCILKIGAEEYEKDDFVKYYKLVEFEEASEEELDVSDVYEQYITIKAYLQKANQYKLTLTEEETKSIEENYDSENVDKVKLTAIGITKEEYIRYYSEVMLASKFMQNAGTYYSMPETDYELYKAQYSDGFKMYSYRVLQVTPTATEGEGEEKTLSEADKELAKTNAETALEKVKNGEDFEEVAQEYGSYRLISTMEGYALSNGQLETMPLLYLSESVTNADLYSELINLSAGECTNIIQDGDDYMFAKLESLEDGLDEASETRFKSDLNTMYAQSYIANNTQIIRYLSRAKKAVKAESNTSINLNNQENENNVVDDNNLESDNNTENEENINENLVTE